MLILLESSKPLLIALFSLFGYGLLFAEEALLDSSKADTTVVTGPNGQPNSLQMNLVGSALGGVVNQFSDYVFGPEGLLRIPMDIIDVDDAASIKRVKSMRKLPKVSGAGYIESVDGAKDHFRVSVLGIEKAKNFQYKGNWCWAAAIQTFEVLSGYGLGGRAGQEKVVGRLYGMQGGEYPNETALSFQLVQALANDQDTRGLEIELFASIGWLAEMEDNDFDTESVGLHITDFVDQYIGAHDIVESLMRGEPLLVSLKKDGRTSEEEAFRHIYVLHSAEFSPIKASSSIESKFRGLSAVAEAALPDQTLIQRGTSIIPKLKLFAKRYALRSVTLFDPMAQNPNKETFDIESPSNVTYGAKEFSERLYYVTNKTVAQRVIYHAKQKAGVAKSKLTGGNADASQLMGMDGLEETQSAKPEPSDSEENAVNELESSIESIGKSFNSLFGR